MPTTLLDHLRTHLIAQGIGRDPRVAGPLPPIWRQRAEGVPAPGDTVSHPNETGTDAVIGLVHSGGYPTRRFDIERRQDVVDIWLRTKTWPRAEQLYVDIRRLTIDRTNWTMGTITVIESEEERPLQLLESSTEAGYTAIHALRFETYAADHGI